MSTAAQDVAHMVPTILRAPAVIAASGKSRSGHYSDVALGLFTRPVKIGRRASGWPAEEVAAIQNARIAGKSQDEIKALVRALEAKRSQVTK